MTTIKYRHHLKYINDRILAINILGKIILVANHTLSDPKNPLKLLVIANRSNNIAGVKSKIAAKNNKTSYILHYNPINLLI